MGTYGIAVAVYQDGLLSNWGGAVTGQYGSLNWVPTFLGYVFVVSFSFSHTVSYMLRVGEFLDMGVGLAEAIKLGLRSSASSIVLSGSVITLLLGKYIFSAMLYQNTFSFIIIVAMLFDTFVVHCLALPAMMTIVSLFQPRKATVSSPMSTKCVDSMAVAAA